METEAENDNFTRSKVREYKLPLIIVRMSSMSVAWTENGTWEWRYRFGFGDTRMSSNESESENFSLSPSLTLSGQKTTNVLMSQAKIFFFLFFTCNSIKGNKNRLEKIYDA